MEVCYDFSLDAWLILFLATFFVAQAQLAPARARVDSSETRRLRVAPPGRGFWGLWMESLTISMDHDWKVEQSYFSKMGTISLNDWSM